MAASRLAGLEADLAAAKDKQAALNAVWSQEKEEMQRIQGVKAEIDRVNLEIQQVGRRIASDPTFVYFFNFLFYLFHTNSPFLTLVLCTPPLRSRRPRRPSATTT